MAEKIDLRPKILEIIQKNGPVIPREIIKETGGDTFIVGAVLMQLKDSGKIFVSSTKIGGSPTYYCEGQEEKLQTLEKYLNEKDKYSYNVLKDNKILRDYDQPTHSRISLREIKDFAIPLVVSVNGNDEIFWKWYTTPLEEAESIIKEIILTIPKEDIKEPEETHKEEISQNDLEIETKEEDTNVIKEETIEKQVLPIVESKDENLNITKELKKEELKENIEQEEDVKENKIILAKPSQEIKKTVKKTKEKPKNQKLIKKEKIIKSKNNKTKKSTKEHSKSGFFKKIINFFK